MLVVASEVKDTSIEDQGLAPCPDDVDTSNWNELQSLTTSGVVITTDGMIGSTGAAMITVLPKA